MLKCALTFVVLLFSTMSSPASPLPGGPDGAIVDLRAEGKVKTIFEGPIFTRGHEVETLSGARLICDGTNLNANPSPGPTCTSALDDGSKRNRFTWNGTVYPQFEDIFITSIGGETQTNTEFWGILLNFVFTPVGGCQQQLKTGDEVLFAFDAFSKHHTLKLSGPKTARVGNAVEVKVVDGSTGTPIKGAEINGKSSDSDGMVALTFENAGIYRLKAEKADSIRSNQLEVLIV